jgi:hypothetical protein
MNERYAALFFSAPLSPDLRTLQLVLALSLDVDVDYFSRHSERSVATLI